jgi:L-threonylcarbamoyladenylate synthase
VTGRVTGRIVAPDPEGIRAAVEILRAESVVAFPTETVYGLGADAFSRKAIAEVYRLKNRPSWNPLIVHVADAAAARSLAGGWPSVADELAARFWPGPLTMVLELHESFRRNEVFQRTGGTIAVRVPAHPVALRLLEASGLPLAAPSANRSESISPTTAEHVLRSLPDVPLVLDGGPSSLGIESTVLDVTTPTPTLLRPGALGLRAIREVTGRIALPGDGPADGVVRPSPGMSRRHYAPRARVVLAREIGSTGPDAGVLAYEGEPGKHTELLSADPREYAADLYAALHRLDDAGVTTIVVQEPPDTEDWLAVRDRLKRAAAS